MERVKDKVQRDFSEVDEVAAPSPSSSASKPKTSYVKYTPIKIEEILEQIEVTDKKNNKTLEYKVKIEFEWVATEGTSSQPKAKPVFVTQGLTGADRSPKSIQMPISYIVVKRKTGYQGKGFVKTAILTWKGKTNVELLHRYYDRLSNEFIEYVINSGKTDLYPTTKPIAVGAELKSFAEIIDIINELKKEIENADGGIKELRQQITDLKAILKTALSGLVADGLTDHKTQEYVCTKWSEICAYPDKQKDGISDDEFKRRQDEGNTSNFFWLSNEFKSIYDGNVSKNTTKKMTNMAILVRSLKNDGILAIKKHKNGSYVVKDHEMIPGLKNDHGEYVYIVSYNMKMDDIYLKKDKTGYRINEAIVGQNLIAIESIPEWMKFEGNDSRTANYYDKVEEEDDDGDEGYKQGEEPGRE
jgi:hypothetical protein